MSEEESHDPQGAIEFPLDTDIEEIHPPVADDATPGDAPPREEASPGEPAPAEVHVDEHGAGEGVAGEEAEPPKAAPVRRAAVDHHTDINLALMKRVQKISVEIPFASQNYRRLQKVVLSVKDHKHIVDEARGGVYGVASRPDIEVQTIVFPAQEDSQAPASIPVLFSDSRQVYVLSARQEDELLLAVHRSRPCLGEIQEAYIRAGDRKLNLEDDERVANAAEKLRLFEGLDPAAALEVERKEYGGDNDDDSTSDEEEKSVRKKVVKKRHHHHGKQHGHKNAKK